MIYVLIILGIILLAIVSMFLYAWSYAKSQGYTLKQLWKLYNQIEDDNENSSRS